MGVWINFSIKSTTFSEIIDALEKICEVSDDYGEIENYVQIIEYLEDEKEAYFDRIASEDLILEDYLKLERIIGEHNGRWDETAIEDSCRMFQSEVCEIADNHNFIYSKGKDFEDELKAIKDDGHYYPLDVWTSGLAARLEDYFKSKFGG